MLFRLEMLACEASLTFSWPSAAIYIYKQQAAPRTLLFGPMQSTSHQKNRQTNNNVVFARPMDKLSEHNRNISGIKCLGSDDIVFLGIKT